MTHSTPLDRKFLLEGISELWEKYPDYRFGQLAMNLTRDENGEFQDPWEWSTDQWERRIREYAP